MWKAMLVVLALALPAGAELVPGAKLDQSNADEAKDLLPAEVHNHYKKGEYANRLVDFPDSRWQWDDGFEDATKWNGEHLVLDEHKAPIDKDTGKRPEYIRGLPFPTIDPNDPTFLGFGMVARWRAEMLVQYRRLRATPIV